MDDSTLENKEGRGERQGLEKKDPQSAGSGAGDVDGNGAILDPASKSKDSPLPGSFGGSFSGSPVSSSLLIEDRARSTSPRAPDSAVDDLYLPPLALPSLLAPAVPHAPASSACTTSTTLSSQKDPPVPVQRNMFFGSMLDTTQDQSEDQGPPFPFPDNDVLVPPEESESEPEGCSGEEDWDSGEGLQLRADFDYTQDQGQDKGTKGTLAQALEALDPTLQDHMDCLADSRLADSSLMVDDHGDWGSDCRDLDLDLEDGGIADAPTPIHVLGAPDHSEGMRIGGDEDEDSDLDSNLELDLNLNLNLPPSAEPAEMLTPLSEPEQGRPASQYQERKQREEEEEEEDEVLVSASEVEASSGTVPSLGRPGGSWQDLADITATPSTTIDDWEVIE